MLLALNGIEFPLTQADAEPVRAGDLERASNLYVRSGVRAHAWDLQCATQLLPQADARLVRLLVEGEGHVLSFDSTATASAYLWTSRGAVPTPAVTPAVGYRVPGRNGGGALRVLEEQQVLYRGVCTSLEWTVLAWVRSSDSPTWEHRVWRSDGLMWFDGAGPLSGYGQAAFVQDSMLVLTHGADVHQDWDEVVVVPYAVPDAWVPKWVAFHGARIWPALPFVLAEGAAVPGGAREVQGQMGKLERLMVGPGAWAESFDFTLRGVV
jgi:hypothetical protein